MSNGERIWLFIQSAFYSAVAGGLVYQLATGRESGWFLATWAGVFVLLALANLLLAVGARVTDFLEDAYAKVERDRRPR